MNGAVATVVAPTGSRIVRGAVSAFAVNVLSYAFLFAGQMLIARLLSRSEYAVFTVSISFVAILSLLADLGMNGLFSKLFAEAEEDVLRGREDERGVLLGSALLLRIILSAGVAGLFFIVAPVVYPHAQIGVMSILLLTLLISSRMLIVRSVGESVLRALGKYYLVATFALFDAIAFAALMVLATYRRLGLSDVIWIYTLSNVPGFLLLIASIVQWTRRENIRLRIARKTVSALLRSSLPLAVGTACLTIHTQIDNLLLDKLSNANEVSSYGATMRLSAAMAPFSLVLAAVAAPELTRLLRRNDDVRSRQLTSISLRLLLIAGVAIALMVTALSTEIVPVFLGAKYLSASSLLIWTAWMLTPIFIGTLLMDVSIAAGHSWLMTANAAVCMVAVIAGDLLLIPGAGAAGAMTSKMIAVTAGAGTVLFLSRRKRYLDLRKFLSAISKTFAAAAIATGAFFILRTISVSDFFIAFVMLVIFGMGIHFGHVLPVSEARALLKRIRHKDPLGGTA